MNITRWQRPALWAVYVLISLLLPAHLWAQADTASIDGTVMDATGAVVPDAKLVLTSVQSGVERETISGPRGLFSFPTLRSGDYELTVTATGFRTLQRSGISLRPNQKARLDVSLEVGALTETVTVSASVTPLNFENATQETGVGPQVLNKLPLLASGGSRNIVSFALLIPGVNNGGTGSAQALQGARVNGSMAEGDDAVLDGATMSTMGGNSGFVNVNNFRMIPDMVSEYRLITSNYEPHWGASSGAQLVTKTRSGSNEYHGGVFEYHRNTVFNARPWNAPFRPPDKENDYGGFFGGPIPGLNRGNMKTFGYFLFEGFRIVGGVNLPTLSIPSLKQRSGDFTDWEGNQGLIPIYDPATTTSDGAGGFTRDQFNCMGVPNVICPSRISNSLANQWFQHLPTPTSPGAVDNFVPPKPAPFGQANQDYFMYKIDHHPNDANHISGMWWDDNQHPERTTFLPELIARKLEARSFKDMVRLNWDRTFSPTLLNTFNYGWTHATFDEGVADAQAKADQLPQIAGVQSHASPPSVNFSDGFEPFTHPGGPRQRFSNSIYVYNNLTTWVKGKHTFKFGGEYWAVRRTRPLGSGLYGQFNFDRPTTGLLGVTSGSPIASFLLERASRANSTFSTLDTIFIQRDSYMAHFGDTWKITPRLTLSIGVRWDMFRPAVERDDNMSFLDPTRANPGAGGRPGALVFAGDQHGEPSFGSRYPEHLFKKAFAPRLGIAYAINDKTVVRAGYGVFYSQIFYPQWSGGIGGEGSSPDGFATNAVFSATQGGLEPAMILSEGFPQNFPKPPFIDLTHSNGRSIYYRDFNGARMPYSQQWNFTIERELASDTNISLAYIANKGNRLMSGINPINTLDPALLSMGPQLRAEFQPGMTELHGVPLPYDGWVEQLGCSPSVAQALLPYPQYCSTLRANNENAAQSTYHSFQLKIEKNFSRGTYLLASYTNSKMLTNGGNVQVNGALHEAFSPFERHRTKSLAQDDIPHSFTMAWVYELPFGRGRRFASNSGALNTIVGGWTVSSIFRGTSGNPFWARSTTCNTPGQFRVQCVPALLEGANPYLQDVGSFDPANGGLFNEAAFEPISSFGQFGYYGAGPRILPNVRQPGLKNTDVSIYKDTKLTEKLNLQLRFEFFNVFNNHYFVAYARFAGVAFNRNLGSPNFGKWTGAVSNPRNIQMGIRLEF